MKPKKAVALFIITLCFIFSCALSCSALSGDVNSDGEITTDDARLALRCASAIESLSEDEINAADVDRDGYVTLTDARRILAAAAEIYALPEHSYTDWVTVTEPTCTEYGEATCHCTTCDETFIKYILPNDHKFKEATCTEPEICTVCGKIRGEPLGHTTRAGTCTRCNEKITGLTVMKISGKEIALGDNPKDLVSLFGRPTYIYDDEKALTPVTVYVYAADYTNLNIFFISQNAIVEMFSNNEAAVVTDGEQTVTINDRISNFISSDAPIQSTELNGSYANLMVDTQRKNVFPSGYAVLVFNDDYKYSIKNTTDFDLTEKLVWHLTNGCRAKNNIDALSYNEPVAAVAKSHSDEMAQKNYFSHEDSSNQRVYDRLDKAKIQWTACSENICAGVFDAFGMVNGWYNSSAGHRDSILSSDYTQLGVGVAYNEASSYKAYGTQNFIG